MKRWSEGNIHCVHNYGALIDLKKQFSLNKHIKILTDVLVVPRLPYCYGSQLYSRLSSLLPQLPVQQESRKTTRKNCKQNGQNCFLITTTDKYKHC